MSLQLEATFYQKIVGVDLGPVNCLPWTFCDPSRGDLWAQFRCSHTINHISDISQG